MKKNQQLLIGLGAALVAAAAALYFFNRKGSGREKPPKKAPQLPIENPGDQSEFTTAASESEMG